MKNMQTSIYQKVARQICSDFSGAEQLPAERLLSEKYGCSRGTIRAALKFLSRRGTLAVLSESGYRRGIRLPLNIDEKMTRNWTIVVFMHAEKLHDPNYLDYIGGVIHASHLNNVNLVLREIDEFRELNSIVSLEQLSPGISADAYLLTAYSERICSLLENEFKPCVVLGEIGNKKLLERRRITQVYLPAAEKLRNMLERLTETGHRRILCVTPEHVAAELQSYCRQHQLPEDAVSFCRLPWDPTPNEVKPEIVDTVTKAIGTHTALLLPFCTATSISIYRTLIAQGYEIPRRLSLVMDSGFHDYFIRAYELDTFYSSARAEGESSISELVSQLRSGCLTFEKKFSGFSYIPGRSIGKPMSQEEVREFDRRLKKTALK